MKTDFANVDAYIASCPETIRELLQQVRTVIRKAAPGAEEMIGYGMPAYKTQGSVQFPVDRPMPLDLIRRMVEFRVEENLLKSQAAKSTKTRNPKT